MRAFREIYPNIYLVTTDSQETLCRIFCRFQEFYESANSKYRGNIFELTDFLTWFKTEYGVEYFNQWDGFNLPSPTIDQFLKRLRESSSHLSPDESWLLENLSNIKSENFYVIGCLEGDEMTLLHELSHALFYLNDSYKTTMTHVYESCVLDFHPLITHLKKMGYCNDVLIDEFAAYLLFEKDYLVDKGLWSYLFEVLSKDLQDDFHFYLNQLKSAA